MEGNSPEIREGLSIFAVLRDGEQLNCLSFSSPEEAFKEGLAEEAIIGVVDSTLSLLPAHFKRNPVFVKVLHNLIARVAPTLSQFQAAAREQGNGSLFVIDARAENPDGDVAPEDILGGFSVESGGIVPGSYQVNENHRIVSEKGLFRLHPTIHAELLKELKTYSRKG